MRVVSFLLASFLLLGVESQPAVTDDAQWLKDLHRSYVGYTFGDGHVSSLSYDEQLRRDHLDELVTATHVQNVRLVYRYDVHDVKANYTSSTGFTGNVFWFSDQNGITTRLTGNSLPTQYAEDLVWTDAIATLPWHYIQTVDDGGAKLAVVRIRLDGGMPIDLFVDRATGAYKKIDILGAGGDYQEELLVKSYAEVAPGIKMIDAYRYDDSSDYHRREHFVVNPLILDSDLRPPKQSVQWAFGSGNPFPVEFAHQRILVHATVNGVSGKFILDTGADDIYLSGAFARRAHLTPTGQGESYTLYGSVKNDIGRASTITLGDNTLHDVFVRYGSDEMDAFGPDGELGYPIFGAANVMLDFENHTMTLRDPAIVPHPDGAVAVAGSFGEGVPSIPMAINKNLYFDVTLDTGNPDEIIFPYYLLPKYGLHLYAGRDHEGITCGTLDPLTVGPLTYQTPTGCASTGTGRWILAGLDFMNQFRQIDFDYAGGTVMFVPKKAR